MSREGGFNPMEAMRGKRQEVAATMLAAMMTSLSAEAGEVARGETDGDAAPTVETIEKMAIASLGEGWQVDGKNVSKQSQFEGVTADLSVARYTVEYDPTPDTPGDELSIIYKHRAADYDDDSIGDTAEGNITFSGSMTSGSRVFHVESIPIPGDQASRLSANVYRPHVQMQVDELGVSFAMYEGLKAADQLDTPHGVWLTEEIKRQYKALPELESDVDEKLTAAGFDIE